MGAPQQTHILMHFHLFIRYLPRIYCYVSALCGSYRIHHRLSQLWQAFFVFVVFYIYTPHILRSRSPSFLPLNRPPFPGRCSFVCICDCLSARFSCLWPCACFQHIITWFIVTAIATENGIARCQSRKSRYRVRAKDILLSCIKQMKSRSKECTRCM